MNDIWKAISKLHETIATFTQKIDEQQTEILRLKMEVIKNRSTLTALRDTCLEMGSDSEYEERPDYKNNCVPFE